MANIVPKLNLNRTPNIVENNSLIFAKNIRLDVDNTIHEDYGISSIVSTTNLLETIYNICIENIGNAAYDATRDKILELENANIVGIVPNGNEFYLFISGDGRYDTVSFIVKYDENDKTFYPCFCNWNYSGGEIDGYVLNNIRGEVILNIAEKCTNKLIPFKSINLSKSSIIDDESIYTQTPNIPYINLNYTGNFNYIIPNGTYQFYIRYKLKNGNYTDWFIASKELYATNEFRTDTIFGKVKYCNTHTDASQSFIFEVDKLIPNININFSHFQVGFILSHDDAIYARAWKEFNINTTEIQFDYKSTDAEEIEPIEFLKTTYQLYNVGNVTSFKNKLYISNYSETNFNEDLQTSANNIEVTYGINDLTNSSNETVNTYAGYPIITDPNLTPDYIKGLVIDGENKYINDIIRMNFHQYIGGDFQDSFKKPNLISEVIEGSYNSYGIRVDYQIPTNAYFNNTIGEPEWINIIEEQTGQHANSITKIEWLDDNSHVFNYDVTLKLYDKNDVLIDTGNEKEANVGIALEMIVPQCTYIYGNTFASGPNTSFKHAKLILHRKVKIYYTYPAESDTSDGSSQPDISANYLISFDQVCHLTYTPTEIVSNNKKEQSTINVQTLIPYQTYNFYVHYCKINGEITNGYKVGSLTIPYHDKCNEIIYPKFNNIVLPTGYRACFFSMIRTDSNVSTVYELDEGVGIGIEGSCLDLDINVVAGINGLPIKQNDIEAVGDYYHSSNSQYARYFGAKGIIGIKEKKDFNFKKPAYLVQPYNISELNNIELIKCTPYINASSYDDFTNMNLGGFICMIYPINKNSSINIYTDGSNVYKKTTTTYTANDSVIGLKEYTQYKVDNQNSTSATYHELKNPSTDYKYIYSNFNLNCLSLTEEPKQLIKTLYNRKADDKITTDDKTSDENNPDNTTKLFLTFNSLTLNSVYSLPSMYYNMTRKLFYVYNTKAITEFNNTIRSSILEGDESNINLIKFDVEDYYNIPTNRGQIVNLVGIGDVILVHTQDSMFRFNGSNTIQSSQGEIVPTESTPFDTGISEIFGSEQGYAGLKYKKDHIITETGYIFFDRDSNRIYMYSGQGQMIRLEEPIEKLFNHAKIEDITFANDYYNNRFFICIEFSKPIPNSDDTRHYYCTLSYNFSEQIKQFVSLHDFYFKESFSTKTKCYFLNPISYDIKGQKHLMNIYTIDKIRNCIYPNEFKYSDIVYPSVQKLSNDNNFIEVDSIVDIIYNLNYETIKTLDSVELCSNIINSEFPIEEIRTGVANNFKLSEPSNNNKPFIKYLVYTDTCTSQELDYTKESNAVSISDPNSYKYPRFNQGKWTINYFRNIEHTEDIFNYEGKLKDGTWRYDDGRNHNVPAPHFRSDVNSLIEGKYFVIRLFYNSKFKLETLSLKYNNKL